MNMQQYGMDVIAKNQILMWGESDTIAIASSPPRKSKKIKLICQQCGKEFYTYFSRIKWGGGKFCSKKCSGQWRSENLRGEKNWSWKGGKIKRVCKQCDKVFYVFPGIIKKGWGNFCSRKCVKLFIGIGQKGKDNPMFGKQLSKCHKRKISEGNKNKIVSAITRKKISISHKGKKFSIEHRKNLSIIWKKIWCNEEYRKKILNAKIGKLLSAEHKRKISLGHGGTGISQITSKRYYHLRDAKYKKWRKAVFLRDNYTCQECGTKNGNGKSVYLEPHHIKGWAKYFELRYDINNGITLCQKCHRKKHSKIGGSN